MAMWVLPLLPDTAGSDTGEAARPMLDQGVHQG